VKILALSDENDRAKLFYEALYPSNGFTNLCQYILIPNLGIK
jgi:hypothetical protein